MNTCTWIKQQEKQSRMKEVRYFIFKNGCCEHNRYNSAQKEVCDECNKIAYPKVNFYRT